MRNFFFSMLGFFLGFVCIAQPKEITFSDLETLMEENPKPVVVFLHTDWCSYCALMEKKTFKDSEVVKELNKDFYYISFNAETKEDIKFKDHLFKFKKRGLKSGEHELALALGKQNSFPGLVILNSNLEIIYQYFSYLKPKQLLIILNLAN